MLNAADLKSIRDDIEAIDLPLSCVIKEIVETPDGAGGFTEVPVFKGMYACKLDSTSGLERIIGEKWTAVCDYVVTLPWYADCAEDYLIVIDGRTYEVKAVMRRSWQLCLRAYVTETR